MSDVDLLSALYVLAADWDTSTVAENIISEAAGRLKQLTTAPEGSVPVEVAVAISDSGHVCCCAVQSSQPHSDNQTDPIYNTTHDAALDFVKRPLNVAVGILSGYVRRLSDAEQWELRTPACDKKHIKNPFKDISKSFKDVQ